MDGSEKDMLFLVGHAVAIIIIVIIVIIISITIMHARVAQTFLGWVSPPRRRCT